MRHGITQPFRLAAACVLSAIIGGCTIIAPPSQKHTDPGRNATAPPPGKTTKPSTSPVSAPAISPFVSLSNYLAGRQGKITAAVYDKRTGRTWVFHPGVRQDTASIVKVEIMGTALWNAQNAGTSLTSADQALISRMIENSDNDAATSMLANVGGPSAVARFDRAAGLTDTTPSTQKYIPGTTLPGWGLTTTTALDEVKLVGKFAYSNAVLTTDHRSYGLNLMEHVESDQSWGISGGVPAGTTVAIKNGWLPLAGQGWQINSIGWVQGNGRDYVLAVLTSHNPSEQYGIDTIESIARSVYRQLGRR
ncbi:MAG: serine hydrolase [Streptosporangiaceae bacterium]